MSQRLSVTSVAARTGVNRTNGCGGPRRGADALRAGLRVLAAAALCVSALSSPAQSTAGRPGAPAATAAAEAGPSWSALKPAQRDALKPLQRDWAGIDSLGKQKWIEIADRYQHMQPPDQARLQARMAEWAKMTPLERGQARLNYQEAKQARDRQASWEAYQALPAEQRRELADRAAPGVAAAAGGDRPAAGSTVARAASRPDKGSREGAQPKQNTVPAAAAAVGPKPVAPTVLQAQPGATTTLISKSPAPPAHQQKGMPKIATAPEFVDTKTLLPQTGAQSAAPRGGAASGAPAR